MEYKKNQSNNPTAKRAKHAFYVVIGQMEAEGYNLLVLVVIYLYIHLIVKVTNQ